MLLALRTEVGPVLSPIQPILEMGAYESLWLQKGATVKTMADRFASDSTALPSDFVSHIEAQESADRVLEVFRNKSISRFGIRVHRAGDYPVKLRDARHPVELLYYRGAWDLVERPCVAVVGSREPSEDGIRRAQRIAGELVGKGYTVVSGLARGIDTAAHNAAIEAGGYTVAVIGTPIHKAYPAKNRDLQNLIARKYLLISQVPVLLHDRRPPKLNKMFFPERNATMSALTKATIIVEAGEASGTLTQARAAFYQGRKLFILNSCFENPTLTWPERFERENGAIRVRKPTDIWNNLD